MIINLSLGPLDPDAPTDEYWRDLMRAQRDALLAQSDWTQAVDDPTGNAAAWATYRQALRDFPATWEPASTVEFPDPPSVGV